MPYSQVNKAEGVCASIPETRPVKVIVKGLMRTRFWRCFLVLCLASPLLAACATSGGKQPSGALDEAAVVAPAASEYEEELREIVEGRVQAVNDSQTAARSRLLRRKPYFNKEYSEYPSGASGMTLSVNEADSVTAPYWAEVQLAKVRYATVLTRNRNLARNDEDFVRATGTETSSYQLRNGKWKRVGSLFLADKRERLVGGEWQPVQETSRGLRFTDDPVDPKGNWFGRSWRRLRGKN